MKRISVMVMAVVAAMLVGSPAVAKRVVRHVVVVPCKDIKAALASGKSEEDVQKELKVSAKRVKSCTAPAPAKHGKRADK